MDNNYYGQQQMGMGGFPQPQAQMFNPQFGYAPQGVAPGSGVVINPVNFKGTSTLSKEDDELLKSLGSRAFQITPTDLARAKCNHRDFQTGNFTLEDRGNNRYYCHRCKKEFSMIQPSAEALNDLVNMFLDVFQTIKTTWVTPPKDWAETVYQMQILIEQIPEMYKAASKDWSNVERAVNNQVTPAYAGGYYNNPLNNYPMNNSIPNQFMGYATQQPPMMGGYQQMMPGQPMMGGVTPQMPTAVGGAMNQNPFYATAPQQQVPQMQMNNQYQQQVPQMMQQQQQMQQPVQQQMQQQQVAPKINIPMPGQPQQVNPVKDNTTSASVKV